MITHLYNMDVGEKVLLHSLLLVFISFLITYCLSFTFKALVPTRVWPVENNEFKLTSKASVFSMPVLWGTFDTNFYMSIIYNGYDKGPFTIQDGFKNWAFFPAYPYLVRFAGFILNASTFGSFFYAGMLVSHIFFVLGLVFLFKLVKKLGMEINDWKKLCILLIAFPSSYFFHIAYTESLFFALSTLALYLIFDKRYLKAALIIALLGVTKLPGVVLIIPLISHYYLSNRNGRSFINLSARLAPLLVVSISGMIMFFTYMYVQTGDFLAPIKIQSVWKGTGPTYLTKSLSTYIKAAGETRTIIVPNLYLALILIVAVPVALIILLREKSIELNCRISLFLYGLAYFFLINTDIESVYRYILVLLPFHLAMLFATRKRELSFILLILIFAALKAMFLLFFVNGYPAYGF